MGVGIGTYSYGTPAGRDGTVHACAGMACRPQQAGSELPGCQRQRATLWDSGGTGGADEAVGRCGEPLTFEIVPVVFAITLRGDCLREGLSRTTVVAV